ncbi:hypothetical protein ES705_16601 [subsurface metagenome]
MKKYLFLALKKEEFLTMIDVITHERLHLKTKKITDDSITIACHLALPITTITFRVKEEENNLRVTRIISWIPFLWTLIPFLIVLEAITFGFSYIFEDISVWSYLIVGFVWLLLTTFLIYYVFAEVEEILNKLYKVEV